MFQAMRETMLSALQDMQTAVQEAQTAVALVQKVRDSAALDRNAQSQATMVASGSGTPHRDLRPQVSTPVSLSGTRIHSLPTPRVLSAVKSEVRVPTRSDFATTGNGYLSWNVKLPKEPEHIQPIFEGFF